MTQRNLISAALLLALLPDAQAATMRGLQASSNPEPLRAEPLAEPAPVPLDGFELPAVPEDLVDEQRAGPGFLLQAVKFTGHSVFSDEELQAVIAPWLGKTVNIGQLEEMRLQITRFYTDAGYISSGALLPKQVIRDGVVQFHIVEGRLSEVLISGEERLRPEYLELRLGSGEEIFNTNALQERFQLLLGDPMIERLDGSLRPGLKPGETVLDLKVTRAKPWELRFTIDNQRTIGVGELTYGLEGSVYNLSGWGDQWHGRIDTSEGADARQLSGQLPLGSGNARVTWGYETSDSTLVEGPLKTAKISSDFRDMHIGVEYDPVHSSQRTITLGANLAVRDSETRVDDIPFPFGLGVEDDGTARTSILRLTQALVDADTNSALALRSNFNIGLDAFDSTINPDTPDSRFVSWVGQGRYVQLFGPYRTSLSLAGSVQLTSEPLLPQERFALGGMDTLRGYPENHVVTDNGYQLSLELRQPLPRELWPEDFGDLEALAFFDIGKPWNEGEWSTRSELYSFGVGLSYRFKRVNAELIAAFPQDSVPRTQGSDDLQSQGIHFRLVTELF